MLVCCLFIAGAQKKTINIVRDARIKLIDFGSATYDEDHHGHIVATRHYRPIEIILGECSSVCVCACVCVCVCVHMYACLFLL